jgi:hypothetical protein
MTWPREVGDVILTVQAFDSETKSLEEFAMKGSLLFDLSLSELGR